MLVETFYHGKFAHVLVN